MRPIQIDFSHKVRYENASFGLIAPHLQAKDSLSSSPKENLGQKSKTSFIQLLLWPFLKIWRCFCLILQTIFCCRRDPKKEMVNSSKEPSIDNKVDYFIDRFLPFPEFVEFFFNKFNQEKANSKYYFAAVEFPGQEQYVNIASSLSGYADLKTNLLKFSEKVKESKSLKVHFLFFSQSNTKENLISDKFFTAVFPETSMQNNSSSFYDLDIQDNKEGLIKTVRKILGQDNAKVSDGQILHMNLSK